MGLCDECADFIGVIHSLHLRRTALQCATDSNHRDAELVLRELMGLEAHLATTNMNSRE